MRLENLLTVIQEKFSTETGLIDHGGVLNAQIKEIIPQYELTQYFLELATWNRQDTVEEHTPSAPPEEKSSEEKYETLAGYTPKPDYKPKYPPKVEGEVKPPSKYFAKSGEKTDTNECPMCKKPHMLWQCPDFKMLARAEKLKFIFANKCCLHCLNPGHGYKSCTFMPDRTCGIEGCEDKHHRQLHNYPDSKGRILITAEDFIKAETMLMTHQTCHTLRQDEYIAIRTTTAIISHNGKEKRVVIAMDPCSNSTNIDEDFAKEMGLKIEQTGLVRNINFLESSATVSSDIVSFVLSPLDKTRHYKIKAFTVKNLITGTPVVDWQKVSETYPHLQEVSIPAAHDDDRVHILLGTDYAHLNASSKCVYGADFEPIAELTRLGWAFSGRVKSNQILPGWISQYGRLEHRTYITYIGDAPFSSPDNIFKTVLQPVQISHVVKDDENNVVNQQKTPNQEFETPNEEKALQPELTTEKTAFTQKQPEALQLEPADRLILKETNDDLRMNTNRRNSETRYLDTIKEETSESKEEPKLQVEEVTQAQIDLACLSACDTDPGLFTYMNLAPNVETEEEKLQALDELIRKSWEIEALGLVEKTQKVSSDHKDPSANWTKAEKIAAEKMNIQYLPDRKQFQLSIPWKDDPPKFFKSNRAAVKARQDGVCNRLGDKIVHLEKIFDGYLEKGYIRKLTKTETVEDNVFYLPFFTVLREDSTTPVRIVWDCAARYGGKSLNSEIMATPNCLQPLFKVLMRVRKFPFVVMSDISEMFLKVRLDPKDRRYHRFTFNGEDYEWLVMLFGNRSSPDGSQMVIQENCRLHGEELPEAVETVNQSCYMDDGADSRETEELALLLAQQLIELFNFCPRLHNIIAS